MTTAEWPRTGDVATTTSAQEAGSGEIVVSGGRDNGGPEPVVAQAGRANEPGSPADVGVQHFAAALMAKADALGGTSQDAGAAALRWLVTRLRGARAH